MQENKITSEGILLEQIWDVFNEDRDFENQVILSVDQEERIFFMMDMYAQVKCKKLQKSDPEEMWDEYSEYIGDDIDSLSVFAGSSVINRSNFIKAINSLK